MSAIITCSSINLVFEVSLLLSLNATEIQAANVIIDAITPF